MDHCWEHDWEAHIDDLAELELQGIYSLMDNSPTVARYMLGEFLAHVHVIPVQTGHVEEKV